MTRAFILLLFAALSAKFTAAQDTYTLHFMSGQQLPVHQFNDTSHTDLRFEADKNHFRRELLHIKQRRKAGDYFNTSITSARAERLPVVMRESSRPRESVFAVRLPDGTEKVYYTYDLEEGNYLTEPAMRAFMAGQADAYVTMSGSGWFWSGVGIGTAAGIASRGSLFALAVPPLFALSTKIPTVRIPERKISDMGYQHDPDYAAGFETQARSKHIREALKGSAIGTVLGLVAYTIFDANR